jgi:hypothetical protein
VAPSKIAPDIAIEYKAKTYYFEKFSGASKNRELCPWAAGHDAQII